MQTELEAELESANGKLAITDIDAKLKEQEKTFIAAKASYVKAERGRYEQVFRDAVSRTHLASVALSAPADLLKRTFFFFFFDSL